MYRIALIVDGPSAPKQYRDVLDWALGQPDIEVAALIIQDLRKPVQGKFGRFVDSVKRDGVHGALSRIAFSLLHRLEMKMLGEFRSYLEPCEIGHLVPSHIHVRPDISPSGFVHRYPGADLQRIRDLNLDLLIRCGSGILRGGILTAARHGILSLHHGDNRINRGGPAGFWEVAQRQPYTGFVVQRLEDELDGGEVLFRGSVRTQSSYLHNQVSLYETSTRPLQDVIRSVLGGVAVKEEPHIYYEKLYRQPLLADTLRYFLQTLFAGLARVARRKFSIREHWQVAFLKGDWRQATLRRGVTIAHPNDSFLADPFAVSHGGEYYVFVEEYPYATATAFISVFRIDPALGTSERLGAALKEPFHLSYPFLFWDGDTLYMCPETAGARQIRLYKCTGFPLQWELDCVLIDDVNAVDTSIFRKSGKWWMMTSIKPGSVGGTSALHIFHSETPRGPWIPISPGPVFVDAARGRNGGLLRHGDDIYRVSQCAKFGEYGSSATIHRIVRLDEEGYEEVQVQTVEPGFFPGSRGTHHLHNVDDLLVYDFWKYKRVRVRSAGQAS